MLETISIASIVLLPLLGFVLLALFGRKYIRRFSGILGTLLMLASTVLALYTAWHYFFVLGPVNGAYQTLLPLQFTWLEFSPGLSIDM